MSSTDTRTAAQQYSDRYETSPLWYDHSDVVMDNLSLAEVAKAGGKIIRLRMFFEGRIADVSYCHARLADGTLHQVSTARFNLRSPRTVKGDIIEWAKAEGVFAKGLGLLDEGNWSVLR